jgi:ATP/maltotriose-dependent transcriptional regulator MalT
MVEANLAMLELDRDDLAEAARGLDHAIALQTELGETLAAAKSRALRAMIQLEAGDAPGALGAAHESLSQLQDQGVPDDEATAQTVLALIYSATGDHSAARREIGKAEQLADRRENPAIGLWIEIQAARIQIAAGDPSSTIAKLQRLVEDTRTAGIRRLELEARLTLAQVEGEMGERMGERTSEPSEDLEGLRSEAESLGFKRIVRQIVRPE